MYGWTAWTNAPAPKKTSTGLSNFIGHRAEIRAVNTEMTEVIIHDVQFKWAAGQHIYLRIPSLAPLEAHPFTIASACPSTSSTSSIQLLIEKRSGFTKRLHAAATKQQQDSTGVTAIITAPLGRPPTWAAFETLILISASTGITFTLPVVESIVNNADGLSCVRRIEMLHVVRKRDSTDCYIERVKAAITAAEQAGIVLTVRIAVTCGTSTGTKSCCGSNCQCHNFEMAPNLAVEESDNNNITIAAAAAAETQQSDVEKGIIPITSKPLTETSSLSITPSTEKEGDIFTSTLIERPSSTKSSSSSRSSSSLTPKRNKQIIYSSSRPDIGAFIRGPVEAAAGETQVAVCGGKSIVACVRNCVVRLADERGVQKGTGAQGIAMFTEGYCF
ncbi:hypothetical protein VE03_10724 [Pseudogymnoascus sp. 23342-1-I1]|nr:hypothetical protein VE03_10724 [Pseudogymnoascus sp. 23342-1-I1]